MAHTLRGEIAEIGSQLMAATAHMDLFRSQVLDRVKKLEETMVPDLRIFFEDTDQTQTSDLNSQFEEKVERLRATLVAELDAHRSQLDQSHTEICQRLDEREMVMDDLIVKVTVDLENVALGDVISMADLHCRQLTQSTKSTNQSVLMESLKEIVRVEHSYTVRGNLWDATLLLGIKIIPIGFTGTMWMVGSILANVYIQIVICYFVCMLANTRCPVGRASHQ